MILQTKNLTKRFGGLTAVDSINIDIESGELRSIIGPNGAGKTTLFNLLTGIYSPSEGEIIFGDEPITEFSPEQRARAGIGRSFQVTNIFPELTIETNVRIALQRSDGYGRNFWNRTKTLSELAERTLRIIERVGIETAPSEKASTMPHGEKRRLEIAITIAQNPDLVLLDEPAAGLSVEETEEMIDIIRDLNTDFTIILIEHDINLIMKVSEYISVLIDGAIIAEGSPSEITQNETVQESYLGGNT